MTRFLIFAILGPLLGWMLVWLMFLHYIFLIGWLPIVSAGFLLGFVLYLPLAYAVGILPALAAAGCDYGIESLGVRTPKLFLVGLCGFAGSWLVLSVYDRIFYPAWCGIIGAIPALVCSWLATKARSWRGGAGQARLG